MFGLGGKMKKKKKAKAKKKCPEVKLTKAEEISKQYSELSKCCSVMAKTGKPEEKDDMYSAMSGMYSGGWRLTIYEAEGAGIDVEEIYAHIRRLANKRRAELECELVKLET